MAQPNIYAWPHPLVGETHPVALRPIGPSFLSFQFAFSLNRIANACHHIERIYANGERLPEFPFLYARTSMDGLSSIKMISLRRHFAVREKAACKQMVTYAVGSKNAAAGTAQCQTPLR